MSAPYGPSQAQTTTGPYWPSRPRRGGGIVGPLILIVLGGILLLQNLGYLPWTIWRDIWRLWPLILVLVGIELLLGYRLRGTWLGVVIVALVVAGLAALTAFGWATVAPGAAFETRNVTQSLQGASQAAVTVRFGAGDLTIGPLADRGNDQLAGVAYQGPPELRPQSRYTVSGGVGRLDVDVTGRDGRFGPFAWLSRSSVPNMNVTLSPDVPLTLNVQTGAANGRLDLSRLRVSDLELSTGATTTWVRLPESAGTTTVHASSGAATLTIEIPAGVAAQIRHQGGLSTLDVDQSRFPSAGPQLFRSPNYDTAANRVNLSLDSGVSTITVR